VVILDYHLPGEDGLMVCLGIKAEMPPPGVLLYSAYADASLTISAVLAGVDGIVNKGAPARELLDAIRRVARGEPVLPPVSPELLQAAAKRLDAEDHPVLAMLVHGTPRGEVAAVLGIEASHLAARVKTMVGRLAVEVPLAGPGHDQGTMSPRRMA
jgi:DNA-binding NarL/FixJ family response regulator